MKPTDSTPCEICDGDPRYSVPGLCWHLDVPVGGITATQPREQLPSPKDEAKAETLRKYDAAMATALANVAPVNPKRKKRPVSRRTSAQVTRAAEQENREADYRTRMASPDWLKDQLDVEADFVASLGKDTE